MNTCLNVGFTGTREGMTIHQRKTLSAVLYKCAKTFTHGCCLGADEEAHVSAWALDIEVRKRPSNIPAMTAACAGGKMVAAPSPPLPRNREIVHDSDLLIAAPKGFAEERRSGTWMTVRYARKRGVPILIIWPDGQWKLEK